MMQSSFEDVQEFLKFAHYQEIHRMALPGTLVAVAPKGPQPIPADERFWAKVVTDGHCWIWTGALNQGGYGRFQAQPGKQMLAHRFAYESCIGPVPAGRQLDHLCRRPACVNPAHLEPVTQSINMHRALFRTCCPHQHPLTGENLVITKNGRRRCRICINAGNRRRRAARKAT